MSHPPWIDMITECIAMTPDGIQYGVSRPAIKKFVDSKYHLSMDAATTSQLNRAITHGALRGNFVLPKGPSGKVKLTPKRAENEKLKHAAVMKARESSVSIKTQTPAEQPPKTRPRIRKYTSLARKARARRVPPRKATARD